MNAQKAVHFDVHPSVVFKLGEDLITDDIQALAELVKNGYDADASNVVVRIKTNWVDSETSDVGQIEIVDDGSGMTPRILEKGWLTISNSTKREMKAKGHTTARGRTPLGDKGLGRLGAQRLGDRIDIVTSVGDGKTHRMSFRWSDFLRRDALTDVPVHISSSTDGRKKSGTTITISGLHDPDLLEQRARLASELAKTISPYQEIEKFRVFVTVNDEPLDLTSVDKRLRDASTVRYTFDFNGEALLVRGYLRLAQFRPNAKADRAMWSRIAEADNGHGLREFLRSDPSSSAWAIKPARSKKWWIEFEWKIDLDDVRPRLASDGKPANPGPFSGEIDSFNMGAGSVEEVGVFDKASQLRDLLRDLHGIRIYRDGFNVRAPDDWLGLGKQITSGASWYGLKPGTTMGYVAISARDNQQLTETTDREGFVLTPAYQSFEALLRELIRTAAAVQEFVGRGAVAYRRSFDLPQEDGPRTPDEILLSLTASLSEAEGYLAPMRMMSQELAKGASSADHVLAKYAIDSAGQAREQEIMEVVNRLSRQAAQASEFVDELETYVTRIGSQQKTTRRLQADLEAMTEQLSLTYETMAVGLTAEALAHEIGNIAERLARRSTEIRRLVRRRYPEDARLLRYIEQVQGVVAGLRRQLAHLSPSLRYVRERREDITLSEFMADVEQYYKDRWAGAIDFESMIVDDFSVFMNRGKLLQVLDNLILNSEYWLLERVRVGKLDGPAVSVIVNEPVVSVMDNGYGVDPQVEEALFEPFISRKPSGMGRGLGLFIIRQLLDAEGCEISLDPRRNKHGRRYVFDIDLASVTKDG